MGVPAFTAVLMIAGAPAPAASTPPTQAVASGSGDQESSVSAEQAAAAASSASSDPAVSPPRPDPTQQATGAGSPQTDIIVTARPRPAPGDPLERVNVKSFEATQAVDKAVIGPLALAYEHTLPGPVRTGLRNFIYNLREPVVFLNYLVQIKPGKGAETFGRFAINSTIGGAGLFDVAKRHPFNLPRRPNGFADSLGFYGVKPGPFLFLPLIGPTTLRDLVGDGVDRLVLPLSVGAPFNRLAYTVPAGVIGALDRRAEFDEQLQKIRQSDHPYAARRDFYLRSRQAEIDRLHGHRQPVKGARSVLDTLAPETTTPLPAIVALQNAAASAIPNDKEIPAPSPDELKLVSAEPGSGAMLNSPACLPDGLPPSAAATGCTRR